jgi:hypothetical protein
VNVRKVAEDATTVTIALDAVPGVEAYALTVDGHTILSDGKRHVFYDPAAPRRIGKVQDGQPHQYGAVALIRGDSGYVTVPTPPTPPPPAVALGGSLPARMPKTSGKGGTFYVDLAGGNDSGNGSKSSPWRTIAKALSTVPLSGAFIRVTGGTYANTGTNTGIYVSGRRFDPADPVTVMADTPGGVTIREGNAAPNTWGSWINSCTGIRVQGFVFASVVGATSTFQSHAVIIDSDRIEFTGNVFYESGEKGIQIRGGGVGSGRQSDDVWIIGNTFRPSGSDPFAAVTGLNFPKGTYYGSRGSHWCYLGAWGADPASNWDETNGANRCVIANNVFVGSTKGRVVELGPEFRNGFIVNNTFFGNHGIQIYGDPGYSLNGYAAHDGGAVGVQLYANTGTQQYGTGGNRIANNIFLDLDGHAVYGSGPSEGGNVVDFNLAYDLRNGYGYQGDKSKDYEPNYGSSVLFALGSHNRHADPQLADPAHYGFRPAASSPAASGGDPEFCVPYDIEDVPRSAASLGAYVPA